MAEDSSEQNTETEKELSEVSGPEVSGGESSARSVILKTINASWFLPALTLTVAGGLYLISANSRGLFPFRPEVAVTIPTPTPTPSPSPSPSPIPTSSTTEAPNPTADWKTYRNDKYGFEVKYPANLLPLKDNTNKKIIYFAISPIDILAGGVQEKGIEGKDWTANGYFVNIYVESHDKPFEFDLWFKNEFPYSELNHKTNITISGIIAYEYDTKNEIGAGQPTTVIPYQNKLYIINYAANGKAFNDETIGIYHQILSTFKFISSASSGPAPLTSPGAGGPTPQNSGSLCAQVITPARNPQTGEIKDFTTPCDVPAGWVKI